MWWSLFDAGKLRSRPRFRKDEIARAAFFEFKHKLVSYYVRHDNHDLLFHARRCVDDRVHTAVVLCRPRRDACEVEVDVYVDAPTERSQAGQVVRVLALWRGFTFAYVDEDGHAYEQEAPPPSPSSPSTSSSD